MITASILSLFPQHFVLVPRKVGLSNAKIQNENDCCAHGLIYLLNEQDLLLSFNIECIFNLGNITA